MMQYCTVTALSFRLSCACCPANLAAIGFTLSVVTLAVVSRMRIMQAFTGYDGPLAMVPWQVLIASYDRNGKPLEPQEMALVSNDKLGYLNQLVRLVPHLTVSLAVFSA
jgi:hypothetical protein